ncbi:MAG: agglutinin biogenesis protein MshP [Burkholderiales bacterium]|jgi:MSHA biogenesis protein MshP
MRHRFIDGFSLISGIFLLVVIAVLAGYIVTLSTAQHTSAALDYQGARAYQAAYAGVQWGAYQALRNNSCAGGAGTSIALTGMLAGFAVTVVCEETGYTEGGATRSVRRITATGCSPSNAGACPGTPGNYYVERQIEATLDQ